MPRKSFDKKLKVLNAKVEDMGIDVEERIEKTILALEKSDLKTAKEIANKDNQIDQIEHQIEQYCMNLFALEQPIASDLRMVAGCLKIITDIERVADQCADICEIITTGQVNKEKSEKQKAIQMLKKVKIMFKKAMNVFDSRNIEEAFEVCKSDNEVDEMFSDIVMDVCKNMVSNSEDKVMGEVDLLFITKYIERMGDHCTNVAEWVIYMEKGEHPDFNAPNT